MGGRGYRALIHTPSTALHRRSRDVFPRSVRGGPTAPRRAPESRGTLTAFRGPVVRTEAAPPRLTARTLPEEESTTPAVTRELDHAWQRITEEMRRAVTDSTYA